MKILLPTQKVKDYVLHYTRYSDGIAAAAARRGIQAEIVPFPSDRFSTQIEQSLEDPNTIACFHLLVAEPALRKKTGVQAFIDRWRRKARVVALIYDHPFSWFLAPGVLNAGPHIRFAMGDSSFGGELIGLNPSLAHSRMETLTHCPLVYRIDSKFKPFASRAIDVLVPLSVLGYSCGGDIQTFLNLMDEGLARDVAKRTFDEVWPNPSANFFATFISVAQNLSGLVFDDLRRDDPSTFKALLFVLSCLDEVVRQRRRNEMLNELLRSVGNLNVVVATDPMPWIKVDRRVKFIGRINGHDFCESLADSRIVLNCNPTYPNIVHERVANAMAYGCAVISDINVGLAERFDSNEIVAFNPGSGQTVRDIAKSVDLESVSEAAINHVRREPRYTFDSHLDEIIRIAGL